VTCGWLRRPGLQGHDEDLKEAASGLTYWGQVPVHVTIGGTEFTTALFPKDGRYLVPVKVAVQRAEALGEGAIIEVGLRLNAARRKLRPTVGPAGPLVRRMAGWPRLSTGWLTR
jgi:hypothetical protein